MSQKFKDDRNIYHVTNMDIREIKSPLDNLQMKGGGKRIKDGEVRP